jgi:dihydroorotase-like cyclic amidohydrolase
MAQTIIRNVTLFDGKSTHSEATVAFDKETGLITAVSSGTTGSNHPPGAIIVDGQGCTLLPGLIDAHIHSYGLHLPAGAELSSVLTDPLKCGVTTVCDMHSDTATVWDHQKRVNDEVARARKDGKDGRVTMASLKSAHLGATIDGGWPKPIVLAGHPTDEVCP